jgi:porin
MKLGFQHTLSMKKYHHYILRGLLAVLACGPICHAAAESDSAWERWWEGQHGSGDWFGARAVLSDHGLTFTGWWKGQFFGGVAGGKDQQGAFDEEIYFGASLDAGKLAGLEGLTLTAAVRWRDGRSANTFVGASPAFQPSSFQIGKQWRLMPFYATWESRDLLPVRDMVTVSGGWTNPYFFFIQQPDSRLFIDNALTQTKGLVNNGIPWSGAYNTWGGHIKVKPVEWAYVQAGLYMAIPDALSTANHGLYFQGARPADRNGLFFVGETGVTPKLGTDELPGKYAFGGMVFGLENKSFNGGVNDERWLLYWQADQMIFREPTAASSGRNVVSDGKRAVGNGKAKVTSPALPLNPQGLSAFSFFAFAPPENSAMPFYFHAGLVYTGLIPTRDADKLGAAIAFGSYSSDKFDADAAAGRPKQTYEAVLEFDYKVQVNKWAYVQPFLQYFIRPSGTGLVNNATVLGLAMGVNF